MAGKAQGVRYALNYFGAIGLTYGAVKVFSHEQVCHPFFLWSSALFKPHAHNTHTHTQGCASFLESKLWGTTEEKKAAQVAEALRNHAFVFIKPHANTEAVRKLVAAEFEKRGINVSAQGEITGEEIDKNLFIDQHYYAIASKATILKPHELNIPTDKFKETFGLEWEDALKAGNVFNAMDACKELGVDAAGLDKLWAQAKKDKKLVKFGGGFYCGKIDVDGKSIYSFNGFFMEMRSKFTLPGTSIHYYTVDFDPATTKWEDFRGKVLGPTDPADAPAGSLRRAVYDDWAKLGLSAVPNVGDNAVHASASPFEALAERNNWLSSPVATDAFGKPLLASGVSAEKIKAWSVDPQVPTGEAGKKQSIFDQLEDLDAKDCIAKAVTLSAL